MTYLRTKARVLACLVAAIVAFALSQTCYALEETANVMVDGEYVEVYGSAACDNRRQNAGSYPRGHGEDG